MLLNDPQYALTKNNPTFQNPYVCVWEMPANLAPPGQEYFELCEQFSGFMLCEGVHFLLCEVFVP